MRAKQTQSVANVTILTETGFCADAVLVMEEGKIVYVGPDKGKVRGEVTDGRGMTLVPGFIDLHVHGGAGFDFMDMTVDAARQICRFHAAHGTTGLLATTMTAPLETTAEVIRFYSGTKPESGAAILGLHLEGPFLNKQFKGAQHEAWIRRPSVESLSRLLDSAPSGFIKMITFAPELAEDGVFSLLRSHGVIMSVGHSALGYEEGCKCVRNGLAHATHLGNAMRGLHHRDPGIVGLVLEHPEVTFDLIADGVHVSPAFIRLLARICPPGQMMVITDAIRAAGMPDGVYELGGQTVFVKGDEARLSDGTLAGSVLTLDRALANLIRYTGWPLEKAIRLLTINQAQRLGLAKTKGSIQPGKDADLVLLDEKLQVQATWVEGNRVYFREHG